MLTRPATVRDVPAIASLIATFAQRGRMLFRSHAELYEAIRDFHVAEDQGVILGTCALEIVWADLAEVRSLAVSPSAQHRGIGRALATAVIDEARRLKIHRLFALTYEEAFFARLGFVTVEKSALPLKVWSACIKCPKRLECDEIAMTLTLPENAPSPGTPEDNPNSHPDLHYEVPTPLTQIKSPH